MGDEAPTTSGASDAEVPWERLPAELWLDVLARVPRLWRPVAGRVTSTMRDLVIRLDATVDVPRMPADAPRTGAVEPNAPCRLLTRPPFDRSRRALWLRCALLVDAAALADHTRAVAVVEWLRDAGKRGAATRPCPWNPDAYRNAARAGNIPLLALLTKDATAGDDVGCAIAAAEGGQLAALGWLHRRRRVRFDEYDAATAAAASASAIPVSMAHRGGAVLVAPPVLWSKSVHVAAARSGNIAVLRWLDVEGCPRSGAAYVEAVTHRRLDALRWLASTSHRDTTDQELGERPPPSVTPVPRSVWIRPPRDAAVQAASQGWIEALECLYVAGCPMTDGILVASAARGGHLEAIKWLRERIDPPCAWSSNAVRTAVEGDHMPTLAWLARAGCPIGGTTYVEAAARGRTDLLRWLRCEPFAHFDRHASMEMLPELADPCPWPAAASLYCAAASGNHVSVLDWLCAQRVPLAAETAELALDAALSAGAVHAAGWLMDSAGHLVPQVQSMWFNVSEARVRPILWARENGCAWDSTMCAIAAGFDRVGILMWLRAQCPPCPWQPCQWRSSQRQSRGLDAHGDDSGDGCDHHGEKESDAGDPCIQAALGGALDSLEWLVDAGCPHNPLRTMTMAASRGRLHVLKWCRDVCRWAWTSDVTAAAAAGGQSARLVALLRDSGCPWDARVASAYARRGDAHALQLLGTAHRPTDPAPWDASVVAAALKLNHNQLAHALVCAGCPAPRGRSNRS